MVESTLCLIKGQHRIDPGLVNSEPTDVYRAARYHESIQELSVSRLGRQREKLTNCTWAQESGLLDMGF